MQEPWPRPGGSQYGDSITLASYQSPAPDPGLAIFGELNFLQNDFQLICVAIAHVLPTRLLLMGRKQKQPFSLPDLTVLCDCSCTYLGGR